MKMQKMINLTPEVMEELKKEENASLLIERLLKDYFIKRNYDNLSIPQLEHLVELMKEKERVEKEINGIK